MSDIKVIEGLEPWEVMKAASEGKPVALRNKIGGAWIEGASPQAKWNTDEIDYAIIDESRPEIDWGACDYKFFAQYGGLPVYDIIMVDGKPLPIKLNSIPGDSRWIALRESPYYPWFGGECPVPGNVEVWVTLRNRVEKLSNASSFNWGDSMVYDIIAFRLTGRVL